MPLPTDERYLVYSLIDENKVEIADPKARKVLGQVSLAGRPVSLTISRDNQYAFAAAQDDDTVYVVSIPDRKLARADQDEERIRTRPRARGCAAIEIFWTTAQILSVTFGFAGGAGSCPSRC